jgi:hypothetical protein
VLFLLSLRHAAPFDRLPSGVIDITVPARGSELPRQDRHGVVAVAAAPTREQEIGQIVVQKGGSQKQCKQAAGAGCSVSEKAK